MQTASSPPWLLAGRAEAALPPAQISDQLEHTILHEFVRCAYGQPVAAMIAKQYRASCNLPVMVQPNAGLPVLENMKAVYQ
jgi:methionine synthase I (cobalamin-dependent)